MDDMWTKYEVTMRFVTRLVGSVPADPDLQRKWQESRMPKVKPPSARSIDEIAQEILETTPEDADEGLHIFQRVEGGLALRAATFRAHIKDCARQLSSLWIGKIEKERSFSVKVINGVYYPPEVYWVPILNQDGKNVTEPTGVYQKPIHMRDPRTGVQRSAIKVMEFIEDAMVKVPLLVMKQPPSKQHPEGNPLINSTDLGHLFQYGGVHGYGGERGDGEGRYIAEIREV